MRMRTPKISTKEIEKGVKMKSLPLKKKKVLSSKDADNISKGIIKVIAKRRKPVLKVLRTLESTAKKTQTAQKVLKKQNVKAIKTKIIESKKPLKTPRKINRNQYKNETKRQKSPIKTDIAEKKFQNKAELKIPNKTATTINKIETKVCTNKAEIKTPANNKMEIKGAQSNKAEIKTEMKTVPINKTELKTLIGNKLDLKTPINNKLEAKSTGSKLEIKTATGNKAEIKSPSLNKTEMKIPAKIEIRNFANNKLEQPKCAVINKISTSIKPDSKTILINKQDSKLPALNKGDSKTPASKPDSKISTSKFDSKIDGKASSEIKSPIENKKVPEKKIKKVITKVKTKPVRNKQKVQPKPKKKVIVLVKNNVDSKKATIKPKISVRKEIKLPCKKIKEEPMDSSDTEISLEDVEIKTEPKTSRSRTNRATSKAKDNKDNSSRKLKLYSMWNGPKRHRVASLNAIAKVHCLYENEAGSNLLDNIGLIKREPILRKSKSVTEKKKVSPPSSPITVIKAEPVSPPPPTRTLRCVPGLRAVGKMWDMHDTTSSSEDEYEFLRGIIKEEPAKQKSKPKPPPKPKTDEKKEKKVTKTTQVIKKEKPEPKKKEDEGEKKPIKRRKRAEIIMDLKDMVVRKRMASLNATAILAASYSVEKRGPKGRSDLDSETSSESEEVYSSDENIGKYCNTREEEVKKDDDKKLIEVHATPNKKVAVILNQDTDVTITGVYVNSTTRSTHHEGYCSIAGMQYRISATSHTQTAATAVATETILQSSSASSSQDTSNGETPPSKSYTPLDALSNMQPPAGSGGTPHSGPISHHHLPPHVSQHMLAHGELSPLGRRHGCSSAFSTPSGHCGSQGHHHLQPDHAYIQGEQLHPLSDFFAIRYYQPAGPLISVPHGHTQPPIGKTVPLSEPSPSISPPIQQPPPPSSAGDSSDSEVIITSVTTAKEAAAQIPAAPPTQQAYRFSHYPPAHSSYPPYSYPPQYYPAPPPASAYSHHDICYPAYSPHKYMYRRYLPPPGQYYQPTSPEIYNPQPNTTSQQQAVTATSTTSGSSYQPAPSGPPPPTLIETYPPPPPTLVETYPPPPPHYYSGYGPAPPPCYSHPPPNRPLNYINATYQSCPCPMQSCPKNVHTGPLAGDSKRSNISIAKESIPLPPVALALPLEPASATGPPSPARGSAGMPPPPSPAGATYQPPPPKQETPELPDTKHAENRRKARVGKAMVRNTIANGQNTMLLMCHEPSQEAFLENVKREVESPPETELLTKQLSPEPVPVNEENLIPPCEENSLNSNPPQEKLKEEKEDVEEQPSNIKIETTLEEANLPCVNTVAENVKVKNMKRKLSLAKEASKNEAPSPTKKPKLEKNNGSYKDLIKKTQNVIKINNGKRKLIGETRSYKFKVKRPSKRKLLALKEESAKRLKASKPLSASNFNHTKTAKIKEKSIDPAEDQLIENKEPAKKSCAKKAPGLRITKKTVAPVLIDSIIPKNNVDRTIESVISGVINKRTSKVQEVSSAIRTEKCKVETKDALAVVTAATTPVAPLASTTKEVEVVKSNKEVPKKSTNVKACKVSKVKETKVGTSKRKNKKEVPQAITRVPRRSLQLKWSNGWAWEGKSFEGKVFLNSDEATVIRRCYPAMRHEEGDIIEPLDCVLLKAGQRKNELPFVAKIASLWENPDDGEMMMSLLWYYRPEHTEQGRLPSDQPDEVFASRHKDSNSVACIEDKCYVLTFNEYCRYRKNLRRLEEGIDDTGPCIPSPDPYPRIHRQPPSSVMTSPDMVFFCRRVYDFRQKRIVKNPS